MTSSAVFSLNSDVNLTVVQRSNICIWLRGQNEAAFALQGNNYYFIKLSDKNANFAPTCYLHSSGLTMLAVHNLNYKYIYVYTWTANYVADITRFRVMTMSWPNLFCWSYWRNLEQVHKYLWCMRFEVLPAVNVKTGLMGYKVGFVGYVRTCLRNLLLRTSRLMTIYQAPRRHIKKGKVPCEQKKWLRKNSGIFWSSAQMWPGYLRILWPSYVCLLLPYFKTFWPKENWHKGRFWKIAVCSSPEIGFQQLNSQVSVRWMSLRQRHRQTALRRTVRWTDMKRSAWKCLWHTLRT